jgi:hypothetical protein
MGVIEDWLRHYGARDWDGLASCFSDEGFERIGPFMDVISSKDEYLAFLQRVVPTLGDAYALTASRIAYVDDTLAFAELVEHVEHDGAVRDTPEVIVFGLDRHGRINEMRLYLQRPGDVAPVGGRQAMGHID